MKTRKIVSFSFLISLAIFLFYFAGIKNVNSQSSNKDVLITDARKKNIIEEEKIVVFGNRGQLSSDLRLFLESEKYPYANYLTSNSDFSNRLEYFKKEHKVSQGMSTNFRYYPIVFVNGKAFSGFNEKIMKEIRKAIEEIKLQ